MKLSEICSITGISKRTIHYYIQEALISPAVDEHNGYYVFSEEDCRKLQLARSLRNAGVSVADIRSILGNPETVNYYLSKHLKKLRKDLRRTEAAMSSVDYILTKAPLHPSVPELLDLAISAGIPDPSNTPAEDDLDVNDVSLTNKYLWGAFMNSEPFNDYQEFLWNKLCRIAQENYSDDYIRIDRYLYSLSKSSVDRAFAQTRQHYTYISELTEEEYEAYSDQIKDCLLEVAQDPGIASVWIRDYDQFYEPTARIHSFQLGEIAAEISPFFASYRKNINAVCKMVYDWLMSPDGAACLELLKSTFGRSLDIQNCNHGQLEALASLRIMGSGV